MRLIADISGTNTRLAFVSPVHTTPKTTRSYRNADFDSFEAVLLESLSGNALQFEQLMTAMTGPVAGNTGRLTNLLDWPLQKGPNRVSPVVAIVRDWLHAHRNIVHRLAV